MTSEGNITIVKGTFVDIFKKCMIALWRNKEEPGEDLSHAIYSF